MRENLLALLEEGPIASGRLVQLLGPPSSRILQELRRLTREGLVTTVGPAKQWALVPIANVAETPAIVSAKSTSVPVADDDELLSDDELLDEPDEDADGIDAIAYEADVAPERRARPLRVESAETGTTGKLAWWVGKPQVSFTAEAETQLERMRSSKEGRNTRWHPISDSER